MIPLSLLSFDIHFATFLRSSQASCLLVSLLNGLLVSLLSGLHQDHLTSLRSFHRASHLDHLLIGLLAGLA